MSFSFGHQGGGGAFGGSAVAASGGNQIQMGPDLEEISTEALGFLSFSRDAKIRLLPTPWSSGALPPPTSSLLSVASSNGLVAAAGPDALILASTESVRQAFLAEAPGGSDVKPFSAQLKINLPMRVSHVAFSADESYLVISAENGGGLAVYDVQNLIHGATQSSFELSTNGLSLRALAPNPTVAELFAIVTTNGHLMMANLKERQFVSSPGGQLLKNGVSCVSWSTRGKQLVAGLADGSAYQMTPDGTGKAEIPKPQDLEGDQHGMYSKDSSVVNMASDLETVSSITWLENNIFLMAHTPTTFDTDTIPTSTFHLVTRQPPLHLFQKLPDPSPPFGINRSPPYHFMLRLKDFPPNLLDLIVVSSTASTDIGLFTRSKSPLSRDIAAEKITNVFTLTGMANDARRASLPMSEDLSDTSPIGVAFDLSANEKVQRPLVGEEMNESASPLPALVVLNNEGILAGWWIVYSESVRQGVAYPGLAAAGGGQRPQTELPKTSFAASAQQQVTAFGQPAFSGPAVASNAFSTPSKLATPAFGTPTTPGSGTGAGTFGTPSALGNRGPIWGTPSTGNATPQTGATSFSRPAFGSSTPLGGGGGFGAVGALGANRSSPWAAAAAGITPATGSTFGQPSSFGSTATTSLGGNTAAKPLGAGASGFGSWANQGGFAAAAAQSSAGTSSFGTGSSFATGIFGGGMDTDNSFGAGTKSTDSNAGGLLGADGFKLGSIFKPDGATKDDAPKPADFGSPFFGASFGSTLSQAQNKPSAPDIKEADMDIETVASGKEDATGPSQGPQPLFSASVSTPSAPRVPPPRTTTPPATATHDYNKLPPSGKDTATAATDSKPVSSLSSAAPNKTDVEPPLPPAPFPPSPKVKQEPIDEPQGVGKDIIEPPLPPDPTSKTTFQAGDSSSSSSFTAQNSIDEPPLPPDFIAPKHSPGFVPPKDVPSNLPDDEDPILRTDGTSEGGTGRFDEEGSGEDVAQDLSPITDRNDSRGTTPQSSFGRQSTFSKESSFDESPVGGHFSLVPRQQQPQQTSRPLFGEVAKSVPYLPPPVSRVQQSPRSPSPVRPGVPSRVLRPDTLRSISAPIPQLPETRQALVSPPLPALTRAVRTVPARQLPEDTDEDLTDREDEEMRAELATEVEGTTTLAPFVAHRDYVGDTAKKGIPGQIEKVYRDINSMIDTLGLNARSLEAFTKGHSIRKGHPGYRRDTLEKDEDWVLIEIEDLSTIEDDLFNRLEKGRLQDWEAQCRICTELEKRLIKVRTKYVEIKKVVDAVSDPDQIKIRRSAPLSAQQAFQQNELRKQSAIFQKLLAEAEEGIMLLKAKLVSTSGKTGGKFAVPTVEAVMNTILKMTNMVQKRSGDIDLLENQMRKLGLDSDSNNGAIGGEHDILSTPPPVPGRPGSSTYGLFFTPESSGYGTPGVLGTPAGSLAAGSPGERGTPRKKLNAITPEEVKDAKERIARQRVVTKRLRDALVAAAPKVRAVED